MDLLETCRDCKETKNIELFKKHSRSKTGYDTICKSCHRKFDAAWVRTPYGKCLHLWRLAKYDCNKKGWELCIQKKEWMDKFLPEVTSLLQDYESVVRKQIIVENQFHIDNIQLVGIKERTSQVEIKGSLLLAKKVVDPVLKELRSRVREERKTKIREKSEIMDGYVYVMTNPVFPGLVKVGCALDYLQRLSTFQTYDPYDGFNLEYQVHFPDRGLAEVEVHDLLAAWRIHPKKEWFRVTPEFACQVIDAYKQKSQRE
jgi:hypothetical protein